VIAGIAANAVNGTGEYRARKLGAGSYLRQV